jgi:hypothetical protein
MVPCVLVESPVFGPVCLILVSDAPWLRASAGPGIALHLHICAGHVSTLPLVSCNRREGPAAAGGVRCRLGTVSGGCFAAWYCCKGCQHVAWAARSKVRKGSK